MHISIPELLSDEHSLGIFLLVSVLMGGGAAWLAGRAIAATWRLWWHVALYMLPLSLAVRFLHFALFDGKFLSLHYYLVDYAVRLASPSRLASLSRTAPRRKSSWGSPDRSPAAVPPSARNSRTGSSKRSRTSTPPAAFSDK